MTNLKNILAQLGDAQLVAVSKYQSTAAIAQLYAEGQRVFGESRTQELVQKYEILPKDIQWHFIGHLQTNKVRQTLPYITCVQAIDSEKLLHALQAEAALQNRIIDGLLQLKIADEVTKYGFSVGDITALLQSDTITKLPNVRIIGLMGMASNTDDTAQISGEFVTLRRTFDQFRSSYFATQPHFCQCSMGMSGDYTLALAAGSTMVRIGSSIFGTR